MFHVERTKKGYPALWENGGAGRNTGDSVIVCGSKFEPLRPVYVPCGGHLSNGKHALFIVERGFHVITCSQWRGDNTIKVERIAAIDGNKAILDKLCEFSQGEWDNDKPVSAELEIASERTDYTPKKNYK